MIGCTKDKGKEMQEETFEVFNNLLYLHLNEKTAVPIIYENIDESRIQVTFSNQAILKYDPTDITIKAIKYGYTKVYVEVKDSEYRGVIDVYVQAKEVKKPVFVASSSVVNLNTPFTFFLKDENKVGAARENFVFTVDDEEIATIDENYVVHPKKTGEVTITATLKSNNAITTNFKVKIVEKLDDARFIITTENNQYVMKPGEKLKIYVDGETKTILDKFEYNSYYNDIASIAEDGTILATKPGLAHFSINVRNTNGTAKSGYLYILVDGSENTVNYVERLIAIAMGELGTKEVNTYTKYGDWFKNGYGSYDWCNMFVSWCANQAGIPNSIIPRESGVASTRSWFEKKGLFKYKEEYTPKRGDLIIFLSEGASHIGIVTGVKDGRVYTVEGNTSNMVAERNYPLEYKTITGYATPDYASLNFNYNE